MLENYLRWSILRLVDARGAHRGVRLLFPADRRGLHLTVSQNWTSPRAHLTWAWVALQVRKPAGYTTYIEERSVSYGQVQLPFQCRRDFNEN